MLTEDIMYNALVEKDSSFEGSFIAAVKTTGIFCQTNLHCKKTKKRKCYFL